MKWLKNQIIEYEAQKKLWWFNPNRPYWSTWINQKRRLDYQDSETSEEMHLEVIYQEYVADYNNNFAQNRKKKYWVTDLFFKIKARYKSEFIL